jgi:hypothetical protein
MKRMLVLVFASVVFAGCSERKDSSETTTINSDTVAINPSTVTGDTSTMSSTTTTTTTYVPADGDVMYRDGKLMVWRGSSYVVSDKDINQDGGIIVNRRGEVRRNGKTVQLEEGEAVTRTGRFFNRAGEAIEDGWDATKKGVNKAAGAVKRGAQKVGQEVKDAVD